MNKKLLLGAALVFGLGGVFSSCVDDKESQSTTNVRNSKLEQLQSLANLDKANAEAARILANAQKAAAEADAAYKQAQAEYQNALAEYQNALTEADKQKLAIELEKRQILLEQAKAQLKSTLAKLEQDIAIYKYQAAKYEKDYNDLIAEIDAAKAEEVKNLLDAYQTAAETLIDAKKDLAQATIALSKLESGLASVTETINSDIEKLEDKKVETIAKIEEQKSIIATYEKYAGVKVTDQMVTDAKVNYLEAYEAYEEAREKNNAVETSINEMIQEMQKYADIANSWLYQDFSYSQYTDGGLEEGTVNVSIDYFYEDESYAPAEIRGTYALVVRGPNNNIAYTPIFKYTPKKDYYGRLIDRERVDYYYTANNGNSYYTWYWQYYTNYGLIDNGSGLNEYVAQYEKYVNSISNPAVLANLKKALETAQTTQAAAQKKYDEAETAHATAKSDLEKAEADKDAALKALNEAKDDEKEAAQTKYDAAEKKYNDAVTKNSEAQNAFYTAQRELQIANNSLNTAQSNYNNAEMSANISAQKLADLKEKVAETIALSKNADLTAYDNLIEEKKSVFGEWCEVWVKYQEAQSEYTILANNLNGYVDGNSEANAEIAAAQAKIEQYESDIEQIDETIAEKKDRLAKIEAGEDDEAEAKKREIEDKKLEIEKLTVAVDVAQQKYDIAKAELDAVIKSDESAE